jgi:hypothetical protein
VFKRVPDAGSGAERWAYLAHKSPHSHEVRTLAAAPRGAGADELLLSGGVDGQLVLYPALRILQVCGFVLVSMRVCARVRVCVCVLCVFSVSVCVRVRVRVHMRAWLWEWLWLWLWNWVRRARRVSPATPAKSLVR